MKSKVYWSSLEKPKVSIELAQERMINNEEEEGKGRSAKRPRERLKIQIFPTVVALLSLDRSA